MSRFCPEYQVARHTGVCAATEQPLSPGSPCIAVLCEREEDEGFDRMDFSLEAWEGGQRPDRLFSFWKTEVPSESSKKRMLVDDVVLFDMFERLADDERPHRTAFRFVLALILMRKRKLRFVGRQNDQTGEGDEIEHWLFQPRPAIPDQPPLAVLNPHLTDDDVRELTGQLTEILQSDL